MNDELKRIFADALQMQPSEIDEATSPDNTPAWDSFAMVNIILGIEKRYGLALALAECRTDPTLAEACLL